MGHLKQDDKAPRQAMFTAREPTFSLYKQYNCPLECAGLNLKRDRHYRVLIGNATSGVEDQCATFNNAL
jgi:hypothetical protein